MLGLWEQLWLLKSFPNNRIFLNKLPRAISFVLGNYLMNKIKKLHRAIARTILEVFCINGCILCQIKDFTSF